MDKWITSLFVLLILGSVSMAQNSISYAFWDLNQRPAMEAQARGFQEENPGITVRMENFPFSDYWTRLQTGVAGGAAYDTFWINGPNFPVYVSQGALTNLQPLVDEGVIDLSRFPENLVEIYSYNGDLYGVPKDFDTIGLFYNRDLFDAAGLEYPNEDWTWEDLRNAAEQLTIRDGNRVIQYGFSNHPSTQTVFWNFIYQNGGQVLNEDGTRALYNEPEACEALLFLYDLTHDGFAPTGAELQANEWNPANNLFPAGRVAMMPGGSWLPVVLSQANPSIDVAPLPKGRQRATVIHGLGNVVWSGSSAQDAAVRFVGYLGSEEAQLIQAKTGTVIPAMIGMQEIWVESIPTMNLQVFVDALEYAVPIPSTQTDRGREWQVVSEEVMQDALLGNIPRDQLCQRMTDEANAALDRGAR
jgi:multiple sugar transport system substrate-binding protein